MELTKEQAVSWANSKIGQRIDMDNFAGAQCMDLIVAFCHEHFGWWPKGNARDLAYQGLPAGFKRFQNTPDFLPLPGDIFIWDHDQYGHTGIITSATMTSYTSVEQNGQPPYDGSGPARAYSRGYTNFWGVIRPPYKDSAPVAPKLPPKNPAKAVSKGINYETHVSKVGWMNNVKDGAISGSTGYKLPIEAIKIIFMNGNINGSVEYRAHIAGVGWANWVKSGQIAGTTGQSKAVEALQAKLTGEAANYYNLEYQAHVAENGWLSWVKDGQTAGTTGQKKSMQAIKMKLVRKPIVQGVAKPGTEGLSYRMHLAEEGWLGYVSNNQMAGTTGLNIDAQCLEVCVNGKKENIQIDAHVAEKGWLTNAGGTVGQKLSLQAVKIRLKNGLETKYDITYQVHVTNKGWMQWVKNGEMAGTTGQKLAIQAIRIKLIAK
ncbi:hydrophobic W protein [Serratia fonticola]|uniref:Hydrophobic W protein n=1 Tax=Serratia fonticola TaxID=47917 RepID=A0A542BLB6_SERFO|nr:CHAP domain-containing protein [Serratia fonticola]TQI79267.1 hydrophobic W protein [Serratia fonticola]TQI98708.1 hydrophobic W protein [Serratia fonticola]TVZ68234.1 hydrophobic W protein [Serratia fonticola]